MDSEGTVSITSSSSADDVQEGSIEENIGDELSVLYLRQIQLTQKIADFVVDQDDYGFKQLKIKDEQFVTDPSGTLVWQIK